MVLVSVTRFRLNSGSPRGQLPFFYHTLLSIRQARRAPGFLRGKVFADVNRTYWTMTIWEDLPAARAFQKSGAHKRAMRAMPFFMQWCDEAATGHFEFEGDGLPGWFEAHHALVAHGRFLKLAQPSVDHQERRITAPSADTGQRSTVLQRRRRARTRLTGWAATHIR